MDEWLDVRQVCGVTRLSRSKIYQLIQSSDLPSVAIGRSRRVSRIALDSWMKRQAQRTARTATR